MTEANLQPDINLGLLQLVTYVKDFTEAKEAFNEREKSFIARKLKLFEERLIKDLPESLTSLFNVEVTRIASRARSLIYPKDKSTDFEEWWIDQLKSGALSLSVLLKSKEVSEFKIRLLGAVFTTEEDNAEHYVLRTTEVTNLLEVNAMSKLCLFEPGKTDYLQAYVAEQFLKQYKVNF